MVRFEAHVTGRIQHVGFRRWVRDQAGRLRLEGAVENNTDGSVSIIVEGEQDRAEVMARRLEEQPSSYHRPGIIQNVTIEWMEPRGIVGFVSA